MDDVTHILSAIEQGDPQAAEQLLPLVYDELRRLAAEKLAQELRGKAKPGVTVNAAMPGSAITDEIVVLALYYPAEKEVANTYREQLAGKMLPITVSGDPIEYQVNRNRQGFVIELVNNRGVAKKPGEPAVTDPNAVAHIVLRPQLGGVLLGGSQRVVEGQPNDVAGQLVVGHAVVADAEDGDLDAFRADGLFNIGLNRHLGEPIVTVVRDIGLEDGEVGFCQ